jgi:predicted regulator of Ras-like GTPase activity (Roadblock/LC7/MglB family)
MRANFALPIEMADQIEQIIASLRRMAEAECVMLADISGQLISVHGHLEESDPTLVAALAAGDVAAMAELSRQIGEENPSGSLLHEGKHKSIYMHNIANSFILLVVYGSDTLVGMVRLFASRAAEKLEELAAEFEELGGQTQSPSSADFGAALADELEKAFSEF